MFWDNPKDSPNMQRFKNAVILKMWVKNETRDSALPPLGILILIVVVAAAIFG